jgi:hypothetical protein
MKPGVRHIDHRQINPVAGQPASLQHCSEFEVLHATAGQRRGAVMACQSLTTILPYNTEQQSVISALCERVVTA